MAEKRRFLDVWLVEGNKVYREVPFAVVIDWVQEGRLLEEDRLRPSGTAEWLRVADSPEFSPFLPRPEPFRSEDRAEALEPVQLDFSWRRRHDDEDDDVDMIPLIDVSLVLLVFFMMTATAVSAGILIPTPATETGQVINSSDEVWLGVDLAADGQTPVYSLGLTNHAPAAEDRNLDSQAELLDRLDALLKKEGKRRAEVTIHANKDVRSGVVRQLTVALEGERFRGRIAAKFIGVSEMQP